MNRKPLPLTRSIVLSLLLTLALFLSACTAESSVTDTSRSDSSSVSDNGQEAQSSEEQSEKLLYEDDTVKITFMKIYEEEYIEDCCYIQFSVENKSDTKFSVYPTDAYVNDIATEIFSGVPMDIAPSKTSQNPFFFSYKNLNIQSVNEVEKLEMSFMLMDDDANVICTTDTVAISFE